MIDGELDKRHEVSVREAARISRRSEETVRRWIWSGKLRARKLGNQYFIDPQDLAAVTGGYLQAAEPAVAYSPSPLREDLDMHSQENKRWLMEVIALGDRVAAEGKPVDVVRLIDEAREGLR
jgi:excisionase family DNA binding protein